MKSSKSRKSCLSIPFTQMIGPLFDMFISAMVIFFFVKFLNIWKSRTGWATSIWILWKWASKPTKLAGDGECRLTQFHLIRNNFILQIKFIVLQGCPIKQALLLPGQLAPYNQLLIQPLLLVAECYFVWNVEARVLKI